MVNGRESPQTPPSRPVTKGVRLDTATAVAMNNRMETELMIIDNKSERGLTGELSSRMQTGGSLSARDPRQMTYRNLLTGTNSMAPGALMKNNQQYKRQDRWTPRNKALANSADETRVHTAKSQFPSYDSERLTQDIDPEVERVQAKVQTQLKGRRNFRVKTAETNDNTLSFTSFQKTLKSYGLDLTDGERDTLFHHYEQPGTGSLDYEQFMQAVKGSEFVQTSRSYGFETPDPGGLADTDPFGEPLAHYIAVTDDIPPQSVKSAKAWQQQRAGDSCPFGTDRKIFGGKWMYRTSSLTKAEPVVAPRFGKTSFPARKTINDVIHVIAEKMQERNKTSLALTRMFNAHDKNKKGFIDLSEFVKVLDIYNIQLNDQEIREVYAHFGTDEPPHHREVIQYLPFVTTVEHHFRAHPLGGLAGAGLPGSKG